MFWERLNVDGGGGAVGEGEYRADSISWTRST